MPETRYGEMAGSGIIKTGTTFSVNPVQRFRVVTVTDRLTVPEDSDLPDSAASISFVKSRLARSGKLVAGTGLATDDGVVSVAPVQTLKQLTLTQAPQAPEDAVNVSYLSNVVGGMVTKSDVSERFAKLQSSFAQKTDVASAINDLASKDMLKSQLQTVQATTTTYIDNTVSELAATTRHYIDAALSDVGDTLADRVTKDELATRLEEKASIIDLEPLRRDAITASDLEHAISDLPTRAYVEELIGSRAAEEDIKDLISTLAPRDYVDSTVAGLATTRYVDEAISSRMDTTEGPTPYPAVQYVVPEDEQTVHGNGSGYLLLNPESALGSLTVKFPNEARNGQTLTIATAQELNHLVLTGAEIAGMGFEVRMTLTARGSLHFVYSKDANVWFSLS